ncbi:MAG TPA: DUF1405 domain-containing protein [Bacilli bacterium]
MVRGMIAFYLGRPFLTSAVPLWFLFWTNLLGTVYGYVWYWEQLKFTAETQPLWLLPFVPDSPTASLFFTVSIAFLLAKRGRPSGARSSVCLAVMGVIAALAVVTSVKYGVWAVAMIVAGAVQGEPLVWEHWMLMGSHLAMAVEALLYARFFPIRWGHVLAAAVWTLANDTFDYTLGIYPWLPDELHDDLPQICAFTVLLSVVAIGCAALATAKRRDRESLRLS